MLPLQDDLTSDTPVPLMVQAIQTYQPSKWPLGWHTWENTIQAHQLLYRSFLTQLAAVATPATGQGRGIVTAGGGSKYFPSLWVLLAGLRKLECKLPIEVWYLGDSDLDLEMKALLAPFDVTLVDAFELRKQRPVRILNGWELKPYSVVHSQFQEVLFLDADCYPLRDPSFLFEEPGYARTGAIFWPDYPHWALPSKTFTKTLTPRAWRAMGLKAPEKPAPDIDDRLTFGRAIHPRYTPSIESGAFVLDKARQWKSLQSALWWSEHSDFCYAWVHGDKDAFGLSVYRLSCRGLDPDGA